MRTRVEEKIYEVVQGMGNLTYVYENLQGANYKLNNEQLPAFVNVMPVSGTIRITPMQIKYQPNCAFWFVDKIRIDESAEGIEDVVNRCMDYAYEFILTLNESKFFEPIENEDIAMQVITHDFDANVAGVMITVQLKEKQGLYLCGKPIKEYFHDNNGNNEAGCCQGNQ